jgi:class 3 adenylate cyclase
MTDPEKGDAQPCPNTRAKLEEYLTEMIESPERRREITKALEETFNQERAVMVLDMSGFSRTTQRDGIVPFLLMIHQMKLVVRPAVASNRGTLVKEEADNLFCLFDAVMDAIEASREITERLAVVNLLLPERKRLYVSIGIGFGGILNVENMELFGDELNVASKLGEDVAGMGQILLTQAAARAAQAQTGGDALNLVEHTISISGLSLQYFELEK